MEKVILGLQSFMVTDDVTYGAVQASSSERRRRAQRSLAWNSSQRAFKSLFPELVQKHRELCASPGRALAPAAAAGTAPAGTPAGSTGGETHPAADAAAGRPSGKAAASSAVAGADDGPVVAAAGPGASCNSTTQVIVGVLVVLLLLKLLMAVGPSEGGFEEAP